MRRTLAFAFAVSCFGSLLACTAILGNYTVGDTSSDGGKDGGGDVVQPDGGGNDGGPEGGLQPMVCDVNGNPSTVATDPAVQQDRVYVHTLPGNPRRYRVVTMRNQQEAVAYTINEKLDPPQQPVGLNTFDAPFNIVGISSYDGGFIVLANVTKGGFPRIDAMRYDDNADFPGTPFTIISTVAQQANSDFQFALAPIDDMGGHDFFLAYSYKLDSNTWQVASHTVTMLGGNPLPTEPLTTTVGKRPGGFSILLAKAAKIAFILNQPDGGPGPLGMYQVGFQGNLISGPTILQGPNGADFFPLGATSATGPEDLNAFATGQGDLLNPNVPLGIRAGSFNGQQLVNTKADPNTLPPLVPLTVGELAVDKGVGLWQFLPVQGPQYTAAARTTNNGKGLNVNWFDGAGHLRALRAGPTALFTAESISGGAAALDGPPSPLLASLVVSWINSNSEIRIARIGCLAK